MDRVVVVGASIAGVNAVDALRLAGFDGSIELVGAEPDLPYDRPPLSKTALKEGPATLEPLYPQDWYERRGVGLHLGRAAVGVDVPRRAVTLAGGKVLRYDGLVIATGAAPRAIPNVHPVEGVHVLRTRRDCAELNARLTTASRVAILGAGFIGLEVASTARMLGLEVVVLEKDVAPLAAALGSAVGGWLLSLHARWGVDIRCGVGVRSVTGMGDHHRIDLDDGSTVRADVVVAATGVMPATDWLRDSGIETSNGVLCDEYCMTSAPGVVAAGDICRWYNSLFDETMRIEHWSNAEEQGRAAALRLIGQSESPFSPVPTFWSDQYDAKLRFAGRTLGATGVLVEERSPGSLVARYERDGLIRGVLCVNAPRDLIRYRRQIVDSVPWRDSVTV